MIEFNKVRSSKEIFTDYFLFMKSEGVPTFSYGNLCLALVFSFLAKFLSITVSCGYIHNYIQGVPSTFENTKAYLLDVWKVALLSVLFMMGVEVLGLFLFIIPALILLPALSMLTYDVLFAKKTNAESLSRCYNLSRTNPIQSYGVVFVCYIGLWLLSNLLVIILPFSNLFFDIIKSSVTTVLSETIMVPFVLLYYSLANQNLQS